MLCIDYVLEYVSGGDFLNVIKKGKLSENSVIYFTAELIQIIETLHENVYFLFFESHKK